MCALGLVNLIIGRAVQTIHIASEHQDTVDFIDMISATSEGLRAVRAWLTNSDLLDKYAVDDDSEDDAGQHASLTSSGRDVTGSLVAGSIKI